MKLFIVVFSFFMMSSSYASFETQEHKSYKSIKKLIKERAAQYNPGELLVVFDIDHTLLLIEDCLEGEFERLNSFARFQVMLRKKCPGYLTSRSIPKLVRELQEEEHEVMALTARGNFDLNENFRYYRKGQEKESMLEETLAQLQDRLKYTKNSKKHLDGLFFQTAPGYTDEVKTHEFTQTSYKKKSKKQKVLTYSEGVILANGADKGQALQAFNAKYNKKYKEIIFVDDSLTNIENLECAYLDTENHITVVHYVQFAKKKKVKDPCGLGIRKKVKK